MATVRPVSETENVLRRIPKNNPSYIKEDGSISSYAFRLRSGENGISVNVKSLTTYSDTVVDEDKFQLAELNVGHIRNEVDNGLDVIHDELEDNSAHALITPGETGKISKGQSRALARSAKIIASDSF